MKILSVFSVIFTIGLAVGKDCTQKNAAVNFMKCIEYKTNGFPNKPNEKKYRKHEVELADAVVKSGKKCESETDCDAGLAKYKEGDFMKPGGILAQECSLCRKIGNMLMELFMEGTSKNIRSCIRKNIVVEISEEINQCMKDEGFPISSPYKADEVPDFDRGSEYGDNEELLKESISYSVNAIYQFGKCDNADDALDCFREGINPLTIHCGTTNNCLKNREKKDKCGMEGMFGASCNCLESLREEAQRFLAKLKEATDKAITEDEADDCADTIVASLTMPWTGRSILDVFERVLDNCGAGIGSIRGLIKQGCIVPVSYNKKLSDSKMSRKRRRKLEKKLGEYKQALEVATKLVSAVIDALHMRHTRFCPAACS